MADNEESSLARKKVIEAECIAVAPPTAICRHHAPAPHFVGVLVAFVLIMIVTVLLLLPLPLFPVLTPLRFFITQTLLSLSKLALLASDEGRSETREDRLEGEFHLIRTFEWIEYRWNK